MCDETENIVETHQSESSLDVIKTNRNPPSLAGIYRYMYIQIRKMIENSANLSIGGIANVRCDRF